MASSQSLCIAFLTHEPFFPPSGGGSAEAVYLVEEMVRRGHDVHVFGPKIENSADIEKKFRILLHPFSKWEMGRYTNLRNFKYVAYPFFLERMVEDVARTLKFDLVFSQHAISAVAAGRLKKKLSAPVLMNFPDLLTGFMETWPPYVAPPPLVKALMRYEMSMPARYGVDGVCAISDEFADRVSARGYPREKICPIYYGYDAERFPFQSRFFEKDKPRVVAMHGSFDAHHLGRIALEAVRHVTRERPGTVFRFIGRRTAGLDAFLKKAALIPGFKYESTGFIPYAEVSSRLADANVGIVPYEESAGTHCAFVAKIVEYVASGLPAVSTPLKSVSSYFKGDPMVRFAEFDGVDFGKKIISWLDEPVQKWQIAAAESAARVKTELDWRPLCAKAVDFAEKIVSDATSPTGKAAA